MPTTIKFARRIIIPFLALAPLLSYGQTATTQTAAASGLKSLPTFPASNALLQSALNDLNNCIANALATATAAQTSTTADAVTSQCATQQAKLKPMLPPDAYTAGVADTQQRVAKALTAQASTQ